MEQAIRTRDMSSGLLRPSTEFQSPSDDNTDSRGLKTEKRQRVTRRERLHTISLRFLTVNFFAAALLAVAWINGLVDQIVAADTTRLCILIFAVFVTGLILCGVRAFQIGSELSDLETGHKHRVAFAARIIDDITGKKRKEILSAARMELTQRIVLVRYIANALVLLGLIGTVVGFIIALSSIDAERAKDVDAIAPMVTGLISGMSTALYTTLVGAVLNLWLMANYQVLAHGTVRLISSLIDVDHSRA